MTFAPNTPTSWNRAFMVWIHGIRVEFQPVVAWERRWVRGGFLRRVRAITRHGAALVAVFFCLHCTRPQAVSAWGSEGGRLRPGFARIPHEEVGVASWYGNDADEFVGRPMASGALYDPEGLVCAHRTLPLGSHVEVEQVATGRRVILKVLDRGPFVRGRILDVSRRAARELGFLEQGTARVRLRAVTPHGEAGRMVSAETFELDTVPMGAFLEVDASARWSQDLERTLTEAPVSEAHGQRVCRAWSGYEAQRAEPRRSTDILERILKDRGVDPFITRRR